MTAGIALSAHQKAEAIIEFNNLVYHTSELEKLTKSISISALRDKIAMSAMNGELSGQGCSLDECWNNEDHLAKRAYAIADAMIRQRDI